MESQVNAATLEEIETAIFILVIGDATIKVWVWLYGFKCLVSNIRRISCTFILYI